MSYEGFSQLLCAAGHLRAVGCWDDTPDKCSCGLPFVFRHEVDETNGMDPDDPSTLPYQFQVKTPAVVEVCNLGHQHVTQEATYQIPVR